MSRIGKLPVEVPGAVKVAIDSTKISVEGPKGKLEQSLRAEIKVEQVDNKVVITRNGNSKVFKQMQGLYRQLISNMVFGVEKGFQKKLELIGTGYKANVEGKRLVLNIGYSNPYYFDIPEGLSISVDTNTKILIEGVDKQKVGQAAAVIRKMRPPEPYKGKGIKYSDEIIRRKAGKATK
jgi:large subunit ribosomal protein L6